jgi:nucleoid-associated protein YgaU
MIAANSRYASSDLVTFDVNGSTRKVIMPTEPVASTFAYVSHIYAGTETIDNLAATYFGDPTQWWRIANVNPEIMDWTNIVPGTTLRIPTS